MSTRSCYVFEDNSGKYGVYKHSDGYPTGAANSLLAARKYAWAGTRWEADEYAAAFVTAEKVTHLKINMQSAKAHSYPVDAGGQVRLLQSANLSDMPNDIEYVYVVRNEANDEMNARITVTAYAVDFWKAKTQKNMTVIFSCKLEDMLAVAKAYQKSQEEAA